MSVCSALFWLLYVTKHTRVFQLFIFTWGTTSSKNSSSTAYVFMSTPPMALQPTITILFLAHGQANLNVSLFSVREISSFSVSSTSTVIKSTSFLCAHRTVGNNLESMMKCSVLCRKNLALLLTWTTLYSGDFDQQKFSTYRVMQC